MLGEMVDQNEADALWLDSMKSVEIQIFKAK